MTSLNQHLFTADLDSETIVPSIDFGSFVGDDPDGRWSNTLAALFPVNFVITGIRFDRFAGGRVDAVLPIANVRDPRQLDFLEKILPIAEIRFENVKAMGSAGGYNSMVGLVLDENLSWIFHPKLSNHQLHTTPGTFANIAAYDFRGMSFTYLGMPKGSLVAGKLPRAVVDNFATRPDLVIFNISKFVADYESMQGCAVVVCDGVLIAEILYDANR